MPFCVFFVVVFKLKQENWKLSYSAILGGALWVSTSIYHNRSYCGLRHIIPLFVHVSFSLIKFKYFVNYNLKSKKRVLKNDPNIKFQSHRALIEVAVVKVKLVSWVRCGT